MRTYKLSDLTDIRLCPCPVCSKLPRVRVLDTNTVEVFCKPLLGPIHISARAKRTDYSILMDEAAKSWNIACLIDWNRREEENARGQDKAEEADDSANCTAVDPGRVRESV